MSTTNAAISVLTWHGCYDRRWEGLMVKDAFVHPAKFSPGLIDRIYTHGLAVGWWTSGNTIGDPFGGVAGGGIYAGYHGLNWVGVELEEKFVALGNANLAIHGPKWMALGQAYRVKLLQGDSRRFAELVAADAILTSPPYISGGHHADQTGSWGGQAQANTRDIAGYGAAEGQVGQLKPGDLDAVLTSPPYAGLGDGGPDSRPDRLEGSGASVKLNRDSYGSTAGQIGRAGTGTVDAVITSPPYGDTRMDGGGLNISNEHDGGSFGTYDKGATDVYRTQRSQTNIGNLAGGSVDAVVTSPPYADSAVEKSRTGVDMRKNWETYRASGGGSSYEKYAATQARHSEGYGASAGQIAALKDGSLEGVVTSPPWEDQESAMNAGKFKDPTTFALAMTKRDGAGGRNATTQRSRAAQFDRATQTTYGESAGQLGNVTGETYWQAMRQVYGQCLLALKPGGVMAVVVKDYVKDKARVPLCDQTLRLLLHLGFEPVCRIHAMLVKEHHHNTLFAGVQTTRTERKSFFRRLAEKKGSPRIDWEEVLVVRKAVA